MDGVPVKTGSVQFFQRPKRNNRRLGKALEQLLFLLVIEAKP
jgi:hypothetical protein